MFNDKQKEILIISQRRSRYQYLGILEDYQIIIKTYDKSINYTKLNPHQHFLFKRILHGLNIYDHADIAKMHWDKKRRITKVWKRAQDVLNEWKQWISYKQVQPIFEIFKNSPCGKYLYECPFEYLPDYRNKISFKDLGITYEDIIIKFIGASLLPKNFLNLKPIKFKNEKQIQENAAN